MCLLLIAINTTPQFPLLLLGNRDEFHARASAPAQKWDADGRVVGGRDLVAGGSWLGLRDDGRFAAVTNLRTGVPATAPKSRGWLVRDFALGDESPHVFLDALRRTAGDYGPFNFVVGDRNGVFALSSADTLVRELGQGVHVISNGPIGVHWPKTERLQQRFEEMIQRDAGAIDEARLLDLLGDESQPADVTLPDTGVGLELERRLAPIFIRGDHYGTRASTLLARGADGRRVLHERRFGAGSIADGTSRWQASAGLPFQSSAP
ncbi:MAG: NRDE family protein [Dokdonella sp.]